MHDELVKRLREEASSWCINCCYRAGDCICAAPDDRKKDCDIYSKLQAADAIEELQNRVPKTPHGRLIDADELEVHGGWMNEDRERNVQQTHITFVYSNDIANAPTIIPAEEGE